MTVSLLDIQRRDLKSTRYKAEPYPLRNYDTVSLPMTTPQIGVRIIYWQVERRFWNNPKFSVNVVFCFSAELHEYNQHLQSMEELWRYSGISDYITLHRKFKQILPEMKMRGLSFPILHSYICERFIYSHDPSTCFTVLRLRTDRGNI